MDTSIDPKVIRWASRTSKRAQDEPISKMFANYLLSKADGESVRMVSLPADSWAFEKHLLTIYPELRWWLTGLEAEVQIVKKMQRAAPAIVNFDQSPAVYAAYNMKTSQWLRDCDTHQDIIYFDYMGTWSREKEADVVCIAQKQLCDVFACTISLNRGYADTNRMLENKSEVGMRHVQFILDSTGRHTETPHYKITGTPERVVELFRDHGHPVTLLGGFVYDSPSVVHPHNVTCEMTMVFQSQASLEQQKGK
jgi:hypothetical protein